MAGGIVIEGQGKEMDIRTKHCRTRALLLGLALAVVSVAAPAQDKRVLIPQGFEYSAETPRIRYHYPRGSTKPAVMTGTWIAENVENVKPDFQIDVATVKVTSEPIANFSLTNAKGKWPAGVYRLEIRSDGQLVHTTRFTVR